MKIITKIIIIIITIKEQIIKRENKQTHMKSKTIRNKIKIVLMKMKIKKKIKKLKKKKKI